MKVVIAPDSFKESMSAEVAAQVIEKAILKVSPNTETVSLPVADGGEGTMDILTHAKKGTFYEVDVTGPLGGQTKAKYALIDEGRTAVVEIAEASGLHLVQPQQRNPLRTTTYGTGELIKAALDHEVEKIIVAIGGSATNDCGAGMLQALGAKLTDSNNEEIGHGGGQIGSITQVDLSGLDPRLRKIQLQVACDVTNPLTGPNGASAVFGPQKGATPEMVQTLDTNLKHFADVLLRDCGMDILEVPGSGAAGGLGAALLICGGTLIPGIDLVLDTLSFSEQIEDADYIITGEGKIDKQTPDGKVISGIVKRASGRGVPVIAVAGSVFPGYESLFEQGLTSVHSIMTTPCSLEEALKKAEANLQTTVENIARLL